MRSFVVRIFILAAVLFVWHGVPSVSHAALREASGKKPKFTARLSSNPALRKQQLIVDPEGILAGSVSVTYDPRVVSLSGVLDPADFQITGGFVSVLPAGGTALAQLRPLESFLDPDPRALASHEIEGGFVQIFFEAKRDALTRAKASSVIPNLPGYETVAEDGETGIADTHALLFDYLPKPDDEYQPRAAYTIFATPPIQGTVGDSLTFEDAPDLPVKYNEIGSAFVAGGIPPRPRPIPLPPAVWSGLVLLAAVGVGMKWHRRRLMMA